MLTLERAAQKTGGLQFYIFEVSFNFFLTQSRHKSRYQSVPENGDRSILIAFVCHKNL